MTGRGNLLARHVGIDGLVRLQVKLVERGAGQQRRHVLRQRSLTFDLSRPPRRGEGKLEDDVVGAQLQQRLQVACLQGGHRLLEHVNGGGCGHRFAPSTKRTTGPYRDNTDPESG
jgi:hypothetical protein